MGDKEEGRVKNLKKWVTSFMDGPKEKIEREMTNFEIQNIFLKFSSFWPHDMPIEKFVVVVVFRGQTSTSRSLFKTWRF